MWLCQESIYQAVYRPGSPLTRPSPLAPHHRSPLCTGRDHRRGHQHARRRPRLRAADAHHPSAPRPAGRPVRGRALGGRSHDRQGPGLGNRHAGGAADQDEPLKIRPALTRPLLDVYYAREDRGDDAGEHLTTSLKGHGGWPGGGCAAGGVNAYHKSLLYLVSRALEGRAPGQSEALLLGMAKFFDHPLGRSTLRGEIGTRGGDCVFSPTANPDNSRSNSTSDGGFASDTQTLTSVVMRILGRPTPAAENNYQSNAALAETEPATPAAAAPGQADALPAMLGAELHEPGEQPLAETAEPQTEQPTAPNAPAHVDPEVAVAPHSGTPVVDVLLASGWQVVKPRSKRRSNRG